mmetsp:Transcript_9755/g.22536  ORF Transcript_9755/g.22536 Transcript_9755/m.22536 type:complete len:313 (-) Transcript_9755:264-1202(-)
MGSERHAEGGAQWESTSETAAGRGRPARGLFTDEGGLTFAFLAAEEAEFLYEEIFVARAYFQEGIGLPVSGAPVVVDAGANIGLFSLLCLRLNPRARLFAFEPSPEAFSLLERNLSAFPNVECTQLALGGAFGTSRIHCYAHAPGESSRYPRERAMQQVRLRGALATAMHAAGRAHAASDGDMQIHECSVRPLGALLYEAGVRRVDLLKIDVEGDELAVLHGLGAHLKMVQQVVVEVHDIYGRLRSVLCLLRRHGFRAMARAQRGGVVCGYETVVPASLRLWYVYASRRRRRSQRRCSLPRKRARHESAHRA